jgi:hypothetical protein
MTVIDIDNNTAFRYYRYSAPVHSHTNIARLAFYEFQPGPPSIPTNVSAVHRADQTVEVSWGASFPSTFGLTGYRVTWDNRAVSGSKTIPAGAFAPGDIMTTVLDDLLGHSSYTISVQAFDNQGRHSDRGEASIIIETDKSGFQQIPVNIGMLTVEDVSLGSAINIFSQDTGQYWDIGNDGGWVQVDLGDNPKVVTVLQYQTRLAVTSSEMIAWPLRMLGFKVQASHNENDWVDLYEITQLPQVNTLSYVNLGNTIPYRFYRLLAPRDLGVTSIGLLELWTQE